jgi:hypothetical protein
MLHLRYVILVRESYLLVENCDVSKTLYDTITVQVYS